MNAFVYPNSEYKRNFDFEGMAQHDLAFYLSKRERIPFDEAMDFVKQSIDPVSGIFALSNPEVMYLERNKYGDREIKHMNLRDFIPMLVERELIVAPNLACYIPPRIRKSILAEYIVENMLKRKKDKDMMFLCRMRGDTVGDAYYKTLQNSHKVKNNSVSGMHSSPFTPGYNKSSHSALTSGCRCATSYANSGNEKFLGGLRHYYVPNMVLFHIIVSARHSNLSAIERAVQKWNIYLPDADDCMEVVRRSTQYYWTDAYWENEIYELLKSLTPVERAAFAYTGDLYHIDKYNSSMVEKFLLDLGEMHQGEIENPKAVIKSLDDNYKATATLLCAPLITGTALGDAEEEKPEAYRAVALTALNMRNKIEEYTDFIHAFIRQDYLPLSIAQFPTSRRMSVPTSDTDSTIFTTQHFVDKYAPKRQFDHYGLTIQYIVTFLIAGMAEHTLKSYTANIGVDPSHLNSIEMKNEYQFPVYCLTAMAKHYFAYISAGEGNVYKKMKTEVKGVQLRSSNAPPEVNAAAKKLMCDIMDMVMSGKEIYLKDILDPIVAQEKKIISDILEGRATFMSSVSVNNAASYKQGADAPAVKSHVFWNAVFGDKYGYAPEPPYRSIKVNVTLPNKTAIRRWLDSIEDSQIRRGLEKWVLENSKSDVKLFRLPKPIIQTHGIPKEIIPIIDMRGIVIEVMRPYYLVLEAMGLFMVNEKNTRLLSDEYTESMFLQQDPVSQLELAMAQLDEEMDEEYEMEGVEEAA